DDLPFVGRRAEGHKGAGLDGILLVVPGERVVAGEVVAGELDVARRDVVEVGVAVEPAEPGVVGPDDAAVSGGALAEVDEAVGPDDGAIGVVVAEAGKVVDEHLGLAAVARDAEDTSAVTLSAFA